MNCLNQVSRTLEHACTYKNIFTEIRSAGAFGTWKRFIKWTETIRPDSAFGTFKRKFIKQRKLN
jgi:hypothetical protein